ncbi:MAG: asparagine synthase (glutamine-hydrolyzing) [Gaiellaceae bacterium]|jgi:asparagine synthase (glutamine-hydrolysing)|nr:asparagine synthase (glutamine-hydrolyzing) [Acidobacteriota bacterium]
MCGICGIASAHGPADVDRLAAMSETLVHRGPDSFGEHVDGPVALAARRLSIIDLETGDQPIGNEDGSVHVVQNGEIYNYRELRRELERSGHRFRTHGDTEVLLHLYEEHGDAFASRLRGMFAIAIWDARRRRVVLARDRFGIKPLYYRHVDGELAFASELRALPRGEIDHDAVAAFLAFNAIPAPLTIFRDTRKLEPGHILVWYDDGHVRVERFARPAPVDAADVRTDDDAELVEELRARMRDSVRAHLVSDVPVGVLLSGGVDSALLAALAAEETAEPVRTFSIGFEERSFNELADARRVAERYGTQHRELVLRPDAALLLPALADAFDEPFADSSALPTYLVSQLAAGDVKVALSGEGGDELFGGYYTYVADLLAARVGGLARLARPLVDLLPSSDAKASFDYKAKRFVRAAHLPPLERHHGWKEIFSADARAELTGRMNGFDPVDVLRRRYAETTGADELARLQDVDLGTYLVDDLLVKTDRASMAHSLEARVPYLDTAVTNLALALPTRLKVRGLDKKVLLRKAAEPLLPREIVHGKKRGFSIPAAAWLRGDLEPFARETLSPDTMRRQGFFDSAVVTRILDEHVSGREDLSRQLWGLLAFTLWHERHVERTPTAPRALPVQAAVT